MTIQIYKFKIKQSHFGSDSKGVGVDKVQEWLHSDTIFSALVNSYSRLYGNSKTAEFLNDGKPNFQISSGFLSKNDDLFFPKPKGFLPGQKEGQESFLKSMKELKRTNFLRLETLSKWFKNDSSEEFYNQVKSDGEDYSELFKTSVRGVNTIGRISNKAVPFYRGETFYADNAFLWFFVNFQNDGKAEFEKAVQALCEVGGFGGELNVGYGRVEAEPKNCTFDKVSFGFCEGKNNLLLSLCGTDEAISAENLNGEVYELISRKGYISFSSKRKNPVWCFGEGSVFKNFNPKGKVVNVGEKGFPVYRDLRAFWVNF